MNIGHSVKRLFRSNLTALLFNLFLVYLAYTFCRVLFICMNFNSFADHLTWGYFFHLLSSGLVFDTAAIFYTNALFVLLFLLPLHLKEKKGFYKVVRWLFVIVNTIGVSANVIDCVYYQFTGRRTTMSVLQEFAHEENFMGIMFTESLPYLYLFVFVLLIGWAFYYFFAIPERNAGSKARYYISQFVCLTVAVLVMIAGMRGGVTKATRPITLSNANQYVKQPMDAGAVLNTPFSVLRTWNKKSFVNPDYMSSEEAERLYSPVHYPADSVGEFRPMNVVVFILESFGKQHFGVLNNDLRDGAYRSYTPFLDSLTGESYTFRYSYSNGRKSIDGMPSVLSSIPNFVEPFFLTPAALNEVSGIAGELTKNKGYQSAFFHGAMNGSMGFQAFANATGFQTYWGRTEYNADDRYDGDKDFDGTWAIWDEEFLQFFCDKMTEFKEPFVTSVFTASSHPPFALPERYKGVFPKGDDPLVECIGYTDNAMRLFFEKAKKQPWFEHTIFVITADHTSRNYEPEYLTSLGYYAVPVIFYAPGLENFKGLDEHRIAQQIDIMPTVLGLLRYDRPYVAFGQDVFGVPEEELFAVHYLPAGGIYQFLKGDYMIAFDGKTVQHAYRFRTDRLLQHDVLNSMPQDTLNMMKAELQSIIQQYMERMNGNQLVYKAE